MVIPSVAPDISEKSAVYIENKITEPTIQSMPAPFADVPSNSLKEMATVVGEDMRTKAMGYGYHEGTIQDTPGRTQADREFQIKKLQSDFVSDCAQDIELGNRLRDEMLRRLGRNPQKEINPIKEGSELAKDPLSLRTAASYLENLSRKVSP
jgi:hypothetical protein